MKNGPFCPQCQTPLPSDAPHGLCPNCLLGAAIRELKGPVPEDCEQPAPKAASGNLSPTTPGGRRFVPADAATLAPLFPSLEIQRLIGFGGMGSVYLARQIKLDRLVALKIIRPEAQSDPAFAERFHREARTLARLNHPGIVSIHDFGEVRSDSDSAPLFYFIMEYVDGTNLRQLLGQPLQPAKALTIIPQICDALQYAHQEGIVHRDIKPENILIDTRGRIRIADFGLARLVAGQSEEWTLTETHQVMGTPRYMAPEQMEGSHAVDHRADIYSVGVVFYEMLTGQVPAGHFDPPSRKSRVHPGLDSVVLRAMAREPERRFQSASELRSEVRRYSSEPEAMTDAAGLGLPHVDPNMVDPRLTETSLSGLMSREMHAVGHWLGGQRTPEASRVAPRWLMLLLAMLPGSLLFLPWYSVYLTDQDATRGVDGLMLEMRYGLPAIHMSISPLETATGTAVGGFLILLLILQFAALGRQHPSRGNALTGVVLGTLAFMGLLLHRYELNHKLVNVYANPVTGELPRHFLNFDSSPGMGDCYLGQLKHELEYLWPFFGVAAGLVVLLLMLSSELRHAAHVRPPFRRESLKETSVTEHRAGFLLIVSSILVFLSAAGTCAMISASKQSDEALFFLFLLQLLAVPVITIGLIAGFSLRQGTPRLVRPALVAQLIPITPASLISIPIGAWGLAVLRKEVLGRSESDRSESSPGRLAATSRDPRHVLRFWLKAGGTLLLSWTLVALIMTIMPTRMQVSSGPMPMPQPEWGLIFYTLGSVVVSWGFAALVFSAAGLVETRPAAARRATVLLMIPLTPMWILTFLVGLRCRSILQELSWPEAEKARNAPGGGAKRRVVLVLGVVLTAGLFLRYWSTSDPRPPLLIAVQEYSAAEVRSLLLNYGADPNPALAGHNSPLWWAVANQDPEMIEALLVADADVHFSSSSGITPLMLAAVRGDYSTCNSLISRGADPNVQDHVIGRHQIETRRGVIDWPGNGMTPLMLAADRGYGDVVRLLLEHDADAMLRDEQGRNAAGIALANNYRDVSNIILRHLAPTVEKPPGDLQNLNSVSMFAEHSRVIPDDVLRQDDPQLLGQWLRAGGLPEASDEAGQTAVMRAAAEGRERCVAWLMIAGADVLKRDAAGRTALMLAAERGHSPVVQTLNQMQSLGHDAEFAARIANLAGDLLNGRSIQDFRFDVGASATDMSGQTATMKAASGGHLAAFEILSNMSLCDELTPDGKSWISFAIESRQSDFLCTLLDRAIDSQKTASNGHLAGTRITPELLAHLDSSGLRPLAKARSMDMMEVAGRIEVYVLLVQKMADAYLAEHPDSEMYRVLRQKCDDALLP